MTGQPSQDKAEMLLICALAIAIEGNPYSLKRMAELHEALSEEASNYEMVKSRIRPFRTKAENLLKTLEEDGTAQSTEATDQSNPKKKKTTTKGVKTGRVTKNGTSKAKGRKTAAAVKDEAITEGDKDFKEETDMKDSDDEKLVTELLSTFD